MAEIGLKYDQYSLLVTGATGFVGHSLCASLVAKGLQVRAVVRDAGKFDIQGCEVTHVSAVDEQTDWTAALRGVNVVIHLAARVHVMKDVSADPLAEFRKINLYGTENLARQAARAGVKRLVYVSSIKVNGEGTSGAAYSEHDAPNPQDPYGISKWEAEQVLHQVSQETGMEVVIVRPPLVYGPGVKGNFISLFKAIDKGIPLPLAAINNARSLVYVGNLVDALIVCASHPRAAGMTYLVSDGEEVSTPELLRRLGAEMGRSARLFPCPPRLLMLAGRIAGRTDQIQRLLGSLQVDSGKIRRELNWTPPYTLELGLRTTARWYEELAR